ncbi:MAG: cytochrome-c oxidase, cbb3-type subunit III [Rhodobacteraceae bacterium]|nr:cytochrome-c oxidase, cbb3-type subunit III [Paracoccaceae bacterium]
MSAEEHKDIETTGHEWDGIQEYNNPLPRWWLWTFYITIIWGIGYTIAYPAWPLIERATPGLAGFSTRQNVADDIAAARAANAEVEAQLAGADLASLAPGSPVYDYAVNAGAALFMTNCSQCHGAGADGAPGYPNLLDDAWLWGGDIEAIAYSVRHGIRNDQDPDARWSEMPAFGEMLSEAEIGAVTQYVLSLSGNADDAGLAQTGATLFADNCAACHGENGEGNRDIGAPNLNDAIWLYGGDADSVTETITASRFGVMPPWGERLGDAGVNALAVYVHQKGGGE